MNNPAEMDTIDGLNDRHNGKSAGFVRRIRGGVLIGFFVGIILYYIVLPGISSVFKGIKDFSSSLERVPVRVSLDAGVFGILFSGPSLFIENTHNEPINIVVHVEEGKWRINKCFRLAPGQREEYNKKNLDWKLSPGNFGYVAVKGYSKAMRFNLSNAGDFTWEIHIFEDVLSQDEIDNVNNAR